MSSSATGQIPVTDLSKDLIKAQLERLLAHQAFKSSRRCSALIRYIVERHLSGGEPIKERSLGVAVFGRPAAYDTNADPIVRTAAGEVRKRIAQYYHEPEHNSELRIDVPPGSYTPHFHLSSQKADFSPTTRAAPVPAPLGVSHRLTFRVACAALLTCAAVATSAAILWRKSALDLFWEPMLASTRPILVCIGQPKMASPVSAPPQTPLDAAVLTVGGHIRNVDHIVLPDAIALSRIVGFLGRRNKDYLLQGALSSTLTDLRQGPTILISGMDNPWTLRLVDPLRFHFVRDKTRAYIEDRRYPSQRDWFVDFGEQYSNLRWDFAILARFRDRTTDQPIVVIAGIGENGTIAAGEFVASREFLERLSKTLPAGWHQKNVEIVLSTQVIDRRSGPPRIVASHVW